MEFMNVWETDEHTPYYLQGNSIKSWLEKLIIVNSNLSICKAIVSHFHLLNCYSFIVIDVCSYNCIVNL